MAAVIVELSQILQWCGFDDQAERDAILNDAFLTYEDVLELNGKDISTLEGSYGRQTVNNGRIYFGLRRTKKLKAFLHWTKDFRRVSMTPSIGTLTQEQFLNQLVIATQ